MREWSKERVKKELVALHEKGREMREKEIRAIDREIVRAAYRHCGSWVEAVKAAGIPLPYSPRIRWTEELVQRGILELHEKGESLKAIDVNRTHPKLYRAACMFFDGYTGAVESLGLNYSDYGCRRRWGKEEILEEIIKLVREGKPLNHKWMKENNNALLLAASKKFGDWGKALEQIGVDYRDIRMNRRQTPQGVVAMIREKYKAGRRRLY